MTKYDMQKKFETLTLRWADFLFLENDGELISQFLDQVTWILNHILMFSLK